MPNFIATDPTQNATLDQARAIVSKRTLLGLPCLAIVAQAQGAQDIVEEADFSANKIDASKPVCLLIRRRKGKPADDNNVFPGFGEYVNVGETIEALDKASSAYAGAISMVQNDKTKSDEVYVPGTAENYIATLPEVSKAAREAFEHIWNKA